jgi:hypothetical protein
MQAVQASGSQVSSARFICHEAQKVLPQNRAAFGHRTGLIAYEMKTMVAPGLPVAFF